MREHLGKAVNDIREGNAIVLEKQSNRVTVYLIEQEGEKLPVCYDKMRKTICTVLPREYLEHAKNRP